MKTTLAIGLALAVIRIWIGFNIHPESFHWIQAYKDSAHLFMGGLAVSWWVNRVKYRDVCIMLKNCVDVNLYETCTFWVSVQPWQWWLFWALNVVEVSVAVLSRM